MNESPPSLEFSFYFHLGKIIFDKISKRKFPIFINIEFLIGNLFVFNSADLITFLLSIRGNESKVISLPYKSFNFLYSF